MPILCGCDRRSPILVDNGEELSSCLWLHAPDSIILHIFSFLSVHDLGRVGQTCKSWYRIVSDESLWRNLLQSKLKIAACKIPAGKASWKDEMKRVLHHTPTLLTETLREHTDEVLHVSFSHDGSMFSTTSKDASLKVWDVGYPTQLKYSKDFRELLGWDFTQFSCFNQSDTMVLVSSVKTSMFLDRCGYMAVLSLLHDFEVLRVVTMDPSHLFGAWLDDTTFLGGSLQISLDRFTTTVQIEAYDVPEVYSPMPRPALTPSIEDSSGYPLFTFSSETASLVKFLTVASYSKCPPTDQSRTSTTCLDVEKHELFQDRSGNNLDVETISQDNKVTSFVVQEMSQDGRSTNIDGEEINLGDETSQFTELVTSLHQCSKGSSSCAFDSHELFMQRAQLSCSGDTFQGEFNNKQVNDVCYKVLLDEKTDEASQVVFKQSFQNSLSLVPQESEKARLCKDFLSKTENQDYSFHGNSYLEAAYIQKNENLCKVCLEQSVVNTSPICSMDEGARLLSPHTKQHMLMPDENVDSNMSTSRPSNLDIVYRSNNCGKCTNQTSNGRSKNPTHCYCSAISNSTIECNCSSSEASHVCKKKYVCGKSGTDQCSLGTSQEMEVKKLIFLTGEFAVALHQLGFKNVAGVTPHCLLSAGHTPMDEDLQDVNMVVNYSNNHIHMVRRLDTDHPDHLIDLSGHVTGLCLTSDHRYLFLNCRPWVGSVDRSAPWATPDLSGNIEVRIIDLLTLKDIGVKYTGHKGFSSSNMCCFVFLDVSEDYVASGSEDSQGYLWDRHYKTLLANFPHASGVVNAVGFNPRCQDYLVTVSDDGTIKIWRSQHEVQRLNISPIREAEDLLHEEKEEDS